MLVFNHFNVSKTTTKIGSKKVHEEPVLIEVTWGKTSWIYYILFIRMCVPNHHIMPCFLLLVIPNSYNIWYINREDLKLLSSNITPCPNMMINHFRMIGFSFRWFYCSYKLILKNEKAANRKKFNSHHNSDPVTLNYNLQ